MTDGVAMLVLLVLAAFLWLARNDDPEARA